MKEGSDQATGAAAARPLSETVIQMRACEALRVGRAENAQPEGRAADEDGAANSALAESTLDEEVDKKPAEGEVRCGGNEPWHAGVDERVKEIDMQG
jgi:hypothetical protein